MNVFLGLIVQDWFYLISLLPLQGQRHQDRSIEGIFKIRGHKTLWLESFRPPGFTMSHFRILERHLRVPQCSCSICNRDSVHWCSLQPALFTIAKLWKQARCPTTGEWIKKMWYLYTMEFYSAIRNNDLWLESKWMQLKDTTLSEISRAQKNKDCMFSLICGRYIQKINIYTKTNMIIYKLRCRTGL
jgi:hypothetical protein